MVYGYTSFDPLVVIAGLLATLFYLPRDPARIMFLMPAFLSLYFFIPFVTLLTLQQLVPLLLLVAGLFTGLRFPRTIQPILAAVALVVLLQAGAGLLLSVEGLQRSLLRVSYYFGLFGIFLFAYRACRTERGYRLLIYGTAAIAVVHAAYGLYQIVGLSLGLPVRGIVRGLTLGQVAFEGRFLRINGLASEPKRLGYVLALGAVAFLHIAQPLSGRRRFLARLGALALLAVSILTFSGSYFLALVITLFLLPLIFARFLGLMARVALLWVVTIPFFSDTYVEMGQTLAIAFERRADELEVGTDADRVYRQEFFAEDFLGQDPMAGILGLGIGRYNEVLNDEYGYGVGYATDGTIIPLNSNVLELLLDLGAAGVILIYGSVLLLMVRARRAGDLFMTASLLFLAVQSLSIQVLPFLVMFMGAAVARGQAADEEARAPRLAMDDADRPGLPGFARDRLERRTLP